MDVKIVFLNSDLEEEIFRHQPKEFVSPGQECKDCKLNKSLYSLKQAHIQWHEHFDSIVLSHGFY